MTSLQYRPDLEEHSWPNDGLTATRRSKIRKMNKISFINMNLSRARGAYTKHDLEYPSMSVERERRAHSPGSTATSITGLMTELELLLDLMTDPY